MNKQREGEKRAHLETEKGTQFELSMKCQTSVCICDTLHAACAPVFGLHLAKACEAKSSSDWAHTLGSSPGTACAHPGLSRPPALLAWLRLAAPGEPQPLAGPFELVHRLRHGSGWTGH